MKVLYLVDEFADGGAELGLLTLVEEGFFGGHDLTIVALARASGTVGARLMERAQPGRVLWLSDGPRLRKWQIPFLQPAVRALFRSLQPDIAILSKPRSNLLGRLAADSAPNVVIASFEHMAYQGSLSNWLMRFTGSRVDYILYDHPATWRSMRRVYPDIGPERALFVPLTILKPRLRPAPRPPLRRLLMSGRLSPEKNQTAAIEAIGMLRDRGCRLELTLLGDGPDRGRLERLARRLGLEAQVRFVGFQPDVRPYLQAADFYLQASLTEGLCRSVLEAMAEGLLVVSTDVGAIAEYGVDGRNMIKARSPDRQALAEAIERAAQLPRERIAEIGAAAATTVAETFSPRAVRPVWRRALNALTAAAADRRLAAAPAEPPSAVMSPAAGRTLTRGDA